LKQKNNNIEELFKNKLRNLEADPGANAWASVQSGISSGAASGTAAATAGSWTSTAIVGAMITILAVGGFYFFKNEKEKKVNPVKQPTEVTLVPSEKIPNTTTKADTEAKSSGLQHNIESEGKVTKEQGSVNSASEKSQSTPPKQRVKTSEAAEANNAETVVNEKTIDEILAEHQQFMDEQAANSSQMEAGHAEEQSKKQLEKVQVAKETTPPSQKSSTDVNQQVNTKEEQKLIANQVVFPNYVTADFDGMNDEFKMTLEKSIAIDNLQVNILNNSGTVVGVYNGVYNGWNGKLLNGSFAPNFVYFYQAIIYLDGEQIPKLGSFKLSR